MITPKVDTKLGRGQVAVVSPLRNEMALLPAYLSHYRRLGVDRFYLIDNGSSDGSYEFICAQPDVHAFRTEAPFREANYGMDWVNTVLLSNCLGNWAIYADIDEHLVFTDCETTSIQAYCAAREKSGENTVFAAMIDGYPKGDFTTSRIDADTDVFSGELYFDKDYSLREWPRRPWDAKPSRFFLQVLGGPRCRLTSSLEKEKKRGSFYYTICNQIDRFIDYVPETLVPLLARFWPAELPALHKQPVNLITENFRFYDSHTNNNDRIAQDLVTLVHLKYCEELSRKLAQPGLVGSHYRRGLSYHQLAQAVGRLKNNDLCYEGSIALHGSADLRRHNLIGPEAAKLWTSGK